MNDFVSFFDWYATSTIKAKPWLILGKGPSYAKHTDYDLTAFNVVSLNHVVNQLKVDFSHMIDLDVFDSCQYSIDKNALYLVMPWVPHQDNKPGKQNLADLIKAKPLLAKLAQEGRLLFYNHVPNQRFGNSPLVRVRYFSAEAVINLLALCGAKTIRTLGIDGGASYSNSFSHLNETTLLSNGRESFDRQFSEIAKTILHFNLDVAPLNIQSPIKIYVATTEAQMLSVKVLEYSIRKHASMSVEVIPLHLSGISIPQPKNVENWPRTPFSFQRLLIPQLQGFSGRAIYLDSDMQVFKDIKDIWTQPFDGAQLLTVIEPEATGRNPQFSVMLLDCENLDWNIQDIVEKLNSKTLTYQKLMYEMTIAESIRSQIDSVWNSLEKYKSGETALLHYTDMNTQPWVSIYNPLAYLWFRDLFEAIGNGFISIDLIKKHIDNGYIRPSVMYQIENRIEDSLLISAAAKRLDQGFSAPYMALHSHNAIPWRNRKAIFKAYIKRFIVRSGILKFRRLLKNSWLD